MRSTCSLYIDAGYLLAAAATRVNGTSLRSGIHVEYGALITSLVEFAEAHSGLPVLRVHWYDSANNGVPDIQQERIGELPKVKLRLGRFGIDGEQKGVDLRIGLDLVAHARNGAADVFFLVSGDDDLTEAVEEAQAQGVQVVLLAVPNAEGKAHGVSRHLLRAADELRVVSGESIDRHALKAEIPKPTTIPMPVSRGLPKAAPSPQTIAAATHAPRPPAAATVGSAIAYSGTTGSKSTIAPAFSLEEHEAALDEIAARVLTSWQKSATEEERTDLRQARPSIPRDIDRALLLDASEFLGFYDLPEGMRFRLREKFWQHVDKSV